MQPDLDLRAGLFVILVVEVLFLVAVFPQHVYDVPTAMFFTLALVLLQRRQLVAYACLFPFACLNRETTILLTLLFAVYFFPRLDRPTYWRYLALQLVVYGMIHVAIRWYFADAPGQAMTLSLYSNLQMYARAPLSTAALLLVVGAILLLVLRKWRRAPELMRTAFIIFTPILIGLYFLIGRSFEVRVFIELLPVVAIIGTS